MKTNEIIKWELLETINGFYKEYPLPPMNISDSEWDKLFDIVEAHLLVHRKLKDFEYAINMIARRALYFAQRCGDEEFNITHLSRALQDLSAYYIPSDEIKAMQEELLEKENKLIK